MNMDGYNFTWLVLPRDPVSLHRPTDASETLKHKFESLKKFRKLLTEVVIKLGIFQLIISHLGFSFLPWPSLDAFDIFLASRGRL